MAVSTQTLYICSMNVLFLGFTNGAGATNSIMYKTMEFFPLDAKKSFYTMAYDSENKAEEHNGITYLSIKDPFSGYRRFLIRMGRKIRSLLHMDYSLCSWRYLFRKARSVVRKNNIDVVVGVSGSSFYMKAAFEVARKTHKKLVLLYFDPYTRNVFSRNPKKRLKEEKKWLKLASSVLYDQDGREPPVKCSGPNEPFLIPIFCNALGNKTPISNTVVYGGTFYPGIRDSKILVDYMNAHASDGVKFEIYTNSPEINRKEGLVEVFPLMPSALFTKECEKALAVIAIGNGNNHKLIPSKLLEIIGLRKPIIGLNFPEDTSYFRRYPYYFEGRDSSALYKIKQLSLKDLDHYDPLRDFPERDPRIFAAKLMKCVSSSLE